MNGELLLERSVTTHIRVHRRHTQEDNGIRKIKDIEKQYSVAII